MNNNWSKFVVSAVVAGFVATQAVMANDEATEAEEAPKVEAKKKPGKHHDKKAKKAKSEEGKMACNGKDGCGGKNGCSGMDDATAPAPEEN